ncbi:MAG TPA: PolC-type DNA polymerase III [Bacillota bacterium]|nr:PolC-type DNA polymerase III [Bacillota bacterium]
MDLTKQEKLILLLKQIKMPTELIDEYFSNSFLDRLDVYRQTKTWHFHIRIEQTLPATVFKQFKERLTSAFQSIATIKLTINVINDIANEQMFIDYWQLFLQTKNGLSPGIKDLVMNQQPKVDGNNFSLIARNDAEAVALKKRIDQSFIPFCKNIGLPPVALTIDVNNSAEEFAKFAEEKALEDKQLAAKTREVQVKRNNDNNQTNNNGPLVIGQVINDEPLQMEQIIEEERRVTVQGHVFAVELRKLRSERFLLIVKATDYTDSLEIKMFSRGDDHVEQLERVKEGMWIKARGRIQTDTYSNQLTMMANDIQSVNVAERMDEADPSEKRIELHTHTTMSQLDGVVSVSNFIKQAKKWGHEAIAITDHAVVQAFPEAHMASKQHDLKVIYGLEANLVDDGVPIVYNEAELSLNDATYVVFDVETTGLSAVYDTIIEIAGVKLHRGEVIDKFESFANPHRPLPEIITEITGITDEMLVDAPEVDVVLHQFKEWAGDSVLVAHNATFDIGFLNQGYKQLDLETITQPVIDTLELARFLYPKLGNHRLNTLCKHLNVELVQHHRAIYDAEATAYLFWKFVQQLNEKDMTNLAQLNNHLDDTNAYQQSRPFHCTLLAQNETGLKNLYKLVSLSHTKYFYRVPRIPRSLLQQHREGLLVGSACDNGEVFEAVMQKTPDEAKKAIEFYDYLEVQPPETYIGLIERNVVETEAQILDILRKIVELGKEKDKIVVATGNVHYVDKHEKMFRRILIASQKGNPLNRQTQPDVHFRTTDEMLETFKFLGDDIAKEIVVTNTQKINEMINNISPLKKDLYTPKIDGAEEEVRQLTYGNAKKIYGDPLPEIVEKRLEKELSSIIGHGFAVIYLISHKLVHKSLLDGYLVGSRGSVGSSLVATMTEITEVNPLPPHYVCRQCHYNEFITDGSFASGYDLPNKNCPTCGEALIKDGQDIPFETFLGFEGDKVPDIDLNFSGEYQPKAHNYTKELFGEDNVYRAGTIGTIAERTAYGYVKGFAQDHDLHLKNAEIDRLVIGCSGVKRTTGQHPGGIIVVPQDKEIYDFTPVQFPADDQSSEWKTTHFDFHSIEDNLLKLDILGHDDPTVIRMLQDLTGIDPKKVPIDDEKVMSIFSSTRALDIKPEEIDCETGTLGVPEFGTSFVRQMLEETKPKSFAELVIISGLSHGTDVWLGNAQDLINDGICELSEVIGCRDDIMVYLMQQGLEASLAFSIMEHVRRGRGLKDEWISEMKNHGVPEWYIQSCKKIKYMFPKAHAAAYVLMAVRIAYFKVYYPIQFYAAYFSIRARDFELDTMTKGYDALKKRIAEIKEKGNDASPKEKNLLTVLQVALEMYARGFSFQKVDLYKSDATDFIVDHNSLIPPFNAVDGLGTNAALNIVNARKQGEFLSKEDLRERSKISKTVLDYLDRHGCLEGMAEENQLSLF